MSANEGILNVILVVVFAIVLGGLFALPVMWLWNGCLVPAVHGVNEISWRQAFGLQVLFVILFKTSVSTAK